MNAMEVLQTVEKRGTKKKAMRKTETTTETIENGTTYVLGAMVRTTLPRGRVGFTAGSISQMAGLRSSTTVPFRAPTGGVGCSTISACLDLSRSSGPIPASSATFSILRDVS